MRKIHVLALNTSPRNKGNTFVLLQEAIKGCESMGTSAAVNSCNMFFTVHGISSAGYVSSLGKTQDNPKAMQSAYDLGIKTIMMAKALKDAPQVFGMHSHYAYGTHTK